MPTWLHKGERKQKSSNKRTDYDRDTEQEGDRHASVIQFALCAAHHAALPVDGEEAGAALEPDDALPEVVAADLEPQPQHRGEGVVVLLADLLRPQVVVPGLAKQGQL